MRARGFTGFLFQRHQNVSLVRLKARGIARQLRGKDSVTRIRSESRSCDFVGLHFYGHLNVRLKASKCSLVFGVQVPILTELTSALDGLQGTITSPNDHIWSVSESGATEEAAASSHF